MNLGQNFSVWIMDYNSLWIIIVYGFSLWIIISVIVHHKINRPHKPLISNQCVNYFEASSMILTKIGAQQNFKHFVLTVCLYFHLKECLTKNYIATIFNPFMLGGNKRAYILKFAGLSSCVWCFGTTWQENWLKKSKDTYQNQIQNFLKMWYFYTGFSF